MVLVEHFQHDSAPSLAHDPFPGQIREDIMASLRMLYGSERAETAYCKLVDQVSAVRNSRPSALYKEDMERESDWYRSEVVYMFYAERFGVDASGKPNTFRSLIPMLDYLETLGVTTLYILPFLESPMIDAGFDVSDYRHVRPDLGGDEEFFEFMAAAKKKGFKIKADLILNHTSDHHAWFQAAKHGDVEKLNYFVVRETPPTFDLGETEREGKVAIYKEDDGQSSQRRIMFPDISHSHYRRESVTVNGETKDLYFYHTFYPHQLDLNWLNPDIMHEAVDLLGYWANRGIDIFRLDAVPFFVKHWGTSGENLPETHAIIKILSSCLQTMAPATVIQVEACQWPADIRPYYGEERHFSLEIPGQGLKALQRTDEAQIAYHFPWMPAIWASMVTGDPSPFWAAAQDTPSVPPSASWAIFIRVHDELTLEMVDPNTRKLVYDSLVKKGESFRSGLGVSGRLADFLDNDPRRIQQIFSILLSLPGLPILYFGDDIGEQNNVEFMWEEALQREARSAKGRHIEVKSFVDSRDLGRASIPRERFQEAMTHPDSHSGIIFKGLQNLIRARVSDPVMSRGAMIRVPTNDPNLFCFIRSMKTESGDETRLIIHNLHSEERCVQMNPPASFRPFKGGACHVEDLLGHDDVCGLFAAPGGAIRITLQPYQSFWLKAD